MATQISQPEFGQRLRRLRTQRGLSQRDLAVDAVNPSYISLLESGARVPTLDVVVHLARVLGVELTELARELALAPGDGADRDRDARLVHTLLTSTAIDDGDLAGAERRLTESYRAAISAGDTTGALTEGLALERVLAARADLAGRYRILCELIEVAVPAGIPEALVRVRIDLASAARDVGRLEEAIGHAEQAMREIVGTGFWHSSEHVRLLAVYVSVLSDAGGGAEVARVVDQMLDLAERIGVPATTGRAHWAASVALARQADVERSLGHLRQASEMLANPGTSLRDWAQFSRAAASALMDAGADRTEVTRHMLAARAASAALGNPADATLMASLEVRFALASGDAERAVELAAGVDDTPLSAMERVRFMLAVGRALRRLGRADEAATTLRRAATLAEEASAYRRAAQIWREFNDGDPDVGEGDTNGGNPGGGQNGGGQNGGGPAG
jgi:transcriptional regulator with XRE-family HTH domain